MKKKMILLVMSLAMAFNAVCFHVANAASENEISNGGFEQDKAGWNFNTSYFSITGNDKYSGSKAMQLKYTASSYPTYVTVNCPVNVEKNTYYRVSYYYKQPSGGHIFSVYGTSISSSNRLLEKQYKSVITSWTKNEYIVNSGNHDVLYIEVKDYSSQAPQVYFDDFCVEDAKVTLYVSPAGNDSNPGTEEEPLKTLAGAKEKVRTLRGGNSDIPAEIIFREGTYRFENTVEFSESDSGSEDAEVLYRAADGERVTFSGAAEIDETKAKAVSDDNIKNRLYPGVAEKVVEIDLAEQGFSYTIDELDNVRYYYSLYGQHAEREYMALYVNDSEQTLSEWPNGEDNYVNWTEVVEKGDSEGGTAGGSFKYAEDEPSRWNNLDNVWIGGYPGADYRYERNSVESIDKENKIIKFKCATSGGVKSEESRRWKIHNVLEELDVPGEWYIDRNTMKLYYYPTDEFENCDFEISVLENNMLDLENASHITFEGIDFVKTRSNGIVMTEVSDITVKDCEFKDIGYNGIKITSTKQAETDKHWWQRQKLDAAYNCEISDCVFYNIGGPAIDLDGGNVDTLTSGNNVFKNNIISRVATKNRGVSAVNIRGCGNSVLNNNISSTPFHAITYFGNNHAVKNNEIYNVNKSSDDCGAIYTGRNYNHRGTEIAYNYLHDLNPPVVQSRGFNLAIYWDDSACGQYAHHNIIVNSFVPIYMCGQSNTFSDNTMVNSEQAGMQITNNYQTEERKATYQESAENILNQELYFSAYENMDIGFNDTWGAKNAFNVITGNLNVNAKTVTIKTSAYLYGTVENNRSVKTCSDFVDAENQDYRVKSGSDTAERQTGLLDETFDIETIGLSKDITLNEEFSLVYPKNNEKIDNNDKTDFSWENVLGANQYRLQVAEDSEFKNVVYDETVHYNTHTAEFEKESGKTYYWRVKAINISREMGNEWDSEEVFTFTVNKDFELLSVESEIIDGVSNIKAEIINNSVNEGKAAKIILAVYDESGILKSVESADKNLPYKEITTYEKAIKILKGEKVSLMVWGENQIPLTVKAYNENSGNLIANGDFSEKGSSDRVAKDWQAMSWWQWQWKEGVGRNGTPAMYLIDTNGNYQTFTQEISVKRNTDYKISYYYKQSDPGHTFAINGLSTGTSILAEQWMKDILSDWTRNEYTFNSGENDSIKIVFKEMCIAGGAEKSVDAYFDDIEMYQADIKWIRE